MFVCCLWNEQTHHVVKNSAQELTSHSTQLHRSISSSCSGCNGIEKKSRPFCRCQYERTIYLLCLLYHMETRYSQIFPLRILIWEYSRVTSTNEVLPLSLCLLAYTPHPSQHGYISTRLFLSINRGSRLSEAPITPAFAVSNWGPLVWICSITQVW